VTYILGDAGYQEIEKCAEVQGLDVQWRVGIHLGKRRVMDKATLIGAVKEKLEELKASVRAKIGYPLRVFNCQFDYRKTRYRGLVKNIAQMITQLAQP